MHSFWGQGRAGMHFWHKKTFLHIWLLLLLVHKNCTDMVRTWWDLLRWFCYIFIGNEQYQISSLLAQKFTIILAGKNFENQSALNEVIGKSILLLTAVSGRLILFSISLTKYILMCCIMRRIKTYFVGEIRNIVAVCWLVGCWTQLTWFLVDNCRVSVATAASPREPFAGPNDWRAAVGMWWWWVSS